MKKQIVIDISDSGEIRLETKNFTGKSCIIESEILEKLLGKKTYQQLTPAYYSKVNNKQKTKRYLQLCG